MDLLTQGGLDMVVHDKVEGAQVMHLALGHRLVVVTSLQDSSHLFNTKTVGLSIKCYVDPLVALVILGSTMRTL